MISVPSDAQDQDTVTEYSDESCEEDAPNTIASIFLVDFTRYSQESVKEQSILSENKEDKSTPFCHQKSDFPDNAHFAH